MRENDWLLYGAYGYTGKLIIDEALRKGHTPVLAGRSPNKLKPLAEEKRLDYRIFDLSDQTEINDNLKEFETIFNAAGPFEKTSLPIVKGCLETRTNYLDITGEIGVFEQNFAFNKSAKEKEIALISGVGFDVVPSDCLAKYVSEKIPNATHLELGIAGMSGFSRGTLKTFLKNLPHGTIIRQNRKLVALPLGTNPKKIQFMDKKRFCYPISWGDISTAYRSTDIDNIRVYMALPQYFKYFTGSLEPLLKKVFKLDSIQKLVSTWIEKNVEGPTEKTRQTAHSYLWAKAHNEEGKVFEAWLKTIEPYRLTAISAIKCIEKLRTRKTEIKGTLTPSQAFGKDFILEFPDTKIADSL
ncbi:MAG: Trans-acting enoyl reductase [Promethearchaeota archaeon]|nr:MAG: Trans-acting enoyl reductase [Candidatus Lokiarchaeota archaeon]